MPDQTDTGTTIEKLLDGTLILNNSNAPTGMQSTEAGRIVNRNGRAGFQPAPFAEWALSASVLRAIADFVDDAAGTERQVTVGTFGGAENRIEADQ